MPVILTDLLHKDHTARLCSKTGIVTICILVLTFVLPFIVVVLTHNYFDWTSNYYEQPSITHLNEFLIYLQTDTQVFGIGSTKALNDFMAGTSEQQTPLSPEFDILGLDDNEDGINDRLEISVMLNTDPTKIRNLAILQTVAYRIKDKIDATIKTRFFNQFALPNGVSRLTVNGELQLVQKENFALGRTPRKIGFEPENDIAYELSTGSEFIDLFSKGQRQNQTVEYKVLNMHTLSPDYTKSGINQVQFKFNMKVPTVQKIKYTRNFLELFLGFWIQYLAVLFPFFYILHENLLGYAFKRRILDAKEQSEIKNALRMPDEKKPQKFAF